MQSERILERRLVANSDGIGSHSVEKIGIEWTPGPLSPVPIKSTWRGEIGKPLTNGIIARRARQGYYGEAARQKSLKNAKPTAGLVFRCECGAKDEIRYLTYSYLPRPGYWCPRCRAAYRSTGEKEANLDKQFEQRLKEAAKREYV